MDERTEKCYYLEYGACANPLSKNKGRACVKESCGRYITEAAYFQGVLNGTLKEEKRTPEEEREALERRMAALRPEKTKKQKKRDEKQKAEENKIAGGGFSLGDDPAFKELFGRK